MQAPGAPHASPLAAERERARRLATQVVSLAIAIAGVALLALAVALTWRGGVGFLFLSVLLGFFGVALAILGFFFQLVPFRLEELARLKRETDERQERD